LEGKTGHLGPVRTTLDEGAPLEVSLNWETSTQPVANLHLRGEAVPVSALLYWARKFGVDAGSARFEQGHAAMQLDVSARKGSPPQIRGSARLTDAVLNISEINQPLHIPSAHVQFQKNQMRVRSLTATVGSMEVRGSLMAQLPATLPSSSRTRKSPLVEFDLETPAIDIGELAGLFADPDLPRVWRWFRREKPSVPSLLGSWATRGKLRADQLRWSDFVAENIAASLQFDNGLLKLSDFSGVVAGGKHHGNVTIQLKGGEPSFQLQTSYTDTDLKTLLGTEAPWNIFSGKVSGTLRLAGAGPTWSEVLQQLGGSGEIATQWLAVQGFDPLTFGQERPGPEARVFSGSALFQVSRGQIHISEMVLTPSPAQQQTPSFSVTGIVGFDHRLDLLVRSEASDENQERWTGTLEAPRLTGMPGPRLKRNASISLR
jgi:hypothetical protein